MDIWRPWTGLSTPVWNLADQQVAVQDPNHEVFLSLIFGIPVTTDVVRYVYDISSQSDDSLLQNAKLVLITPFTQQVESASQTSLFEE